MAEVYPFIGTRYNSQLIGSLSKVISPPHDAITPELQNTLYNRHEHNIVRIACVRDGEGEDEDEGFSNRFNRAANTLGSWRSDGIFIEDERPSFYLYEQVFKTADGKEQRRAGFFAKVKLEETAISEDPDAGGQLSGARADMLSFIRSTKANVSPVTALFDDPGQEVTQLLQTRMKEKPWEEMKDEDAVVHRLWVVQKKDLLLNVIESMKSRNIFVAEGQKRYVTAQAYRDEMRTETGKSDGKQPFDFIMMLLLPAHQESLKVEPVHRALTKSIMADVDLKEALEELGDNFTIDRDKVNLADGTAEAVRIEKKLRELGNDGTAIALVHASGGVFFLKLNSDVEMADLYDNSEVPDCVGAVDVCILHNYIINHVLIGNPEYELDDDECLYVETAEQLLNLLKQKKAVCGFLLNPLPVSRMMKIAGSSVLVPMDEGAMRPRPATGLVLRNMQTDNPKPARAKK
jgi:uncharacterized protein (DUF1015 family)